MEVFKPKKKVVDLGHYSNAGLTDDMKDYVKKLQKFGDLAMAEKAGKSVDDKTKKKLKTEIAAIKNDMDPNFVYYLDCVASDHSVGVKALTPKDYPGIIIEQKDFIGGNNYLSVQEFLEVVERKKEKVAGGYVPHVKAKKDPDAPMLKIKKKEPIIIGEHREKKKGAKKEATEEE
jgi:hypothetical protein